LAGASQFQSDARYNIDKIFELNKNALTGGDYDYG